MSFYSKTASADVNLSGYSVQRVTMIIPVYPRNNEILGIKSHLITYNHSRAIFSCIALCGGQY